MAKSKAVAAPVNSKPKAKFEKKELPEADSLGISFVEVADELAAIVAERKRLDEQIKERYLLLRAYMEDEDDSQSWGVRGDGYVVSYVKPKDKESLVKELLIQQGVTMKQIKKATKKTPVTPYVTMRLAGEEE